jgi:hypothetical protein
VEIGFSIVCLAKINRLEIFVFIELKDFKEIFLRIYYAIPKYSLRCFVVVAAWQENRKNLEQIKTIQNKNTNKSVGEPYFIQHIRANN